MEPIAIEFRKDLGTTLPPVRTESCIAAFMDELAHGVCITDFSGRLVLANRVARDELAAGTAVALARDGTLRASSPVGNRELQSAIQRSVQGRRTLVPLEGGRGPATSAVVLPLRDGAGDTIRCAVVLSRPNPCDALVLGYFARRHALTPTEEQVLAALTDGLSAPEAAARMHVAVSTIRSHVRSICKKTRSRGARQVLQRVVILPPVAAMTLRHPLH